MQVLFVCLTLSKQKKLTKPKCYCSVGEPSRRHFTLNYPAVLQKNSSIWIK